VRLQDDGNLAICKGLIPIGRRRNARPVEPDFMRVNADADAGQAARPARARANHHVAQFCAGK
jgi:hypothetical protein